MLLLTYLLTYLLTHQSSVQTMLLTRRYYILFHKKHFHERCSNAGFSDGGVQISVVNFLSLPFRCRLSEVFHFRFLN